MGVVYRIGGKLFSNCGGRGGGCTTTVVAEDDCNRLRKSKDEVTKRKKRKQKQKAVKVEGTGREQLRPNLTT